MANAKDLLFAVEGLDDLDLGDGDDDLGLDLPPDDLGLPPDDLGLPPDDLDLPPNDFGDGLNLGEGGDLDLDLPPDDLGDFDLPPEDLATGVGGGVDNEDFNVDDLEDIGELDVDVDIDIPTPSAAARPAIPPRRKKVIQQAASTDYVMQQMSKEQVERMGQSKSSGSFSAVRDTLAEEDDDMDDETSDAFTIQSLQQEFKPPIGGDIPDPVRVNKPIRQLTKGKPKLTLTMLLPDRTKKLLEVTDDFTGQELMEKYAKKLNLWQTEFFGLCVKEATGNINSHYYRWIDLRKTMAQQMIKDKMTVQLKMKFFKKPKKLFDEQALRVMYLQVKQSFIDGDIPVDTKNALLLAGLQMQITNGDYQPAIHSTGFMKESVKEYVPPGLFHDLDPLYVESLIMERYKKHRGKSETEGIKEYIDLAQRTTCFGASIFKESVSFTNGQPVRIGISENGLLLDEFDDGEYKFCSFMNLGGWAFTPSGFEITMTKPSRSLAFRSNKVNAKSVIDLLSGYYLLLLAIDPGDLPLIQVQNKPSGLPNPHIFHKPAMAVHRDIIAGEDASSRIKEFRRMYLEKSKIAKAPLNLKLLLLLDDALEQDLVLTELDLQFSKTDPLVLKVIVDTLVEVFEFVPPEDMFFEENMNITSIDLSRNPLFRGLLGTESIGKLLVADGFELKELKLRKTKMTMKQAQALHQFLSENQDMERMDFSTNQLGDKGVSAILKPMKGQEKLKAVNFNDNGLTSMNGFFLSQVFAKNQIIEELHLGNNKLEDKGLEFLLKGLPHSKSVSVLDLTKTECTGATIKKLLKLVPKSNIQSLFLGLNTLDPESGKLAAKAIKSECLLHSLDITKAKVGAKAMKAILEAVKKSKRMQILRASDNAIDAVGQRLLVECVSLNLPLTDLQVENCGLSEQTMVALAKALQSNVNLKILHCGGGGMTLGSTGKVWAQALASNGSVYELSLGNIKDITGDALGEFGRGLEGCKTVTRLFLQDTPVGRLSAAVELAKGLASNDVIEVVNLQGGGFDPAALKEFLKPFPGKRFSLQILDLRNNSELKGAVQKSMFRNIPFLVPT